MPNEDELSCDELVAAYSRLELPADEMKASVAFGLSSVWRSPDLADPRQYSGPAPSSVCRYVKWMGLPVNDADTHVRAPLPHTHLAIARERHQCLMRFRTCTWGLQFSRSYGRVRGNPRRERSERVCRLCAAAGLAPAIEDEHHVLMECPSHQSLRVKYNDLPFQSGMLAVMCHADPKRLAEFVCKLKDAHDAAVERNIESLTCTVCKLDNKQNELLMCDGQCCRGFHITCCTPHAVKPASYEPWFCADCMRRRALPPV